MAIELECLLFWGQSVLVMRLYYCYFKHIFLFVKKKQKKKVRKERSMDIIHFPSLVTEISSPNVIVKFEVFNMYLS